MEKTVKLIICDTEGVSREKAENLPFITLEDKKSAAEHKDEKKRVARIVSAYLKRKYVGEWETTENGKPVAKGKFFNVSHCENAVVIAIADRDIGVDAEKVRTVNESLIKHVASEEEYVGIYSDREFFEVWTLKESLVKAQGDGIRENVKTIPAFPKDGVKTYKGEKYCSQILIKGDLIIAVTRKGETPFTITIQTDPLFS